MTALTLIPCSGRAYLTGAACHMAPRRWQWHCTRLLAETQERQCWGSVCVRPPIFGHVLYSCVAKVTRMNVPILSPRIISGSKAKEGYKFSRLLATLSFHKRCFVSLKQCPTRYAMMHAWMRARRSACIVKRLLKMHQIYFRPGLRPGPRWGSLRRSTNTLARFEGPTSKGREGKWCDGEGRGKPL